MNFRQTIPFVFALALAPSILVAPAAAQEPVDTVSVFNQICYSKVPSLQAIRDMALELAWKPLDNDDLSAFGDKDALDVLEGWDVQVGEKFYRLGLTRGDVDEAAAEAFPGFENGATTSCSMVLDGSDANEEIAERMQALAGKEPASAGVQEGTDLETTTWAGGNEDIKVFLFNKATRSENGGVLAVTVISKQ